jgi:thioesterase domain-containing protein
LTDPSSSYVYLPGAGGGAPDFAVFRTNPDDGTRFETIGYPGWQRYVAEGFSAQVLIEELSAQIATRVPHGPIRIIGMSLGGHFGYAVALHLQAHGREIAGFCAIDSFMISSSEPGAGWKRRALAQGLYLLRKRRVGESMRLARSKFWRALLRLARGRLPNLLRRFGSSGRLPSGLAFDPVFEEELSLRLLLRQTAPWIASLDRNPVALSAPSILLRSNLTAGDDAAWRRRCPKIQIFEVSGGHHTLLEAENINSLHEAFITATRGWR